MFRCKYGGCISTNLTCNGEPQCADWSDEDPDLCGLTIPPGNCYLPALSPYAHYVATDCPKCQPGAIVPQHQELNYSCEVGHKLQGSSSVYCHESAWVPQLPTCIPGMPSKGGQYTKAHTIVVTAVITGIIIIICRIINSTPQIWMTYVHWIHQVTQNKCVCVCVYNTFIEIVCEMP
jgi:hypothetical protein